MTANTPLGFPDTVDEIMNKSLAGVLLMARI